jgi:hypothetical protein
VKFAWLAELAGKFLLFNLWIDVNHLSGMKRHPIAAANGALAPDEEVGTP